MINTPILTVTVILGSISALFHKVLQSHMPPLECASVVQNFTMTSSSLAVHESICAKPDVCSGHELPRERVMGYCDLKGFTCYVKSLYGYIGNNC